MTGNDLLIAVPIWLVLGVVTSVMARRRGESAFLGFLGGVLFGPLCIVVMLLSGRRE
jgi:hypothetical protein